MLEKESMSENSNDNLYIVSPMKSESVVSKHSTRSVYSTASINSNVSKKTIKSIFDPFFSSKTYGPGFGLTFALKTVQSHNGIISVESKEGEGTVFLIRLPLKILKGNES